jgi:hypothetical protein
MAVRPAGGGEVVIGEDLSSFFVIVISCRDTLLPLAAATVGTKHSAINPKLRHLVMKVSLRYCGGRGHWWAIVPTMTWFFVLRHRGRRYFFQLADGSSPPKTGIKV